jgi:hypothetical protein
MWGSLNTWFSVAIGVDTGHVMFAFKYPTAEAVGTNQRLGQEWITPVVKRVN